MANDTEDQGPQQDIITAMALDVNIPERAREQKSPTETLEVDASKATRQFYAKWQAPSFTRYNLAARFVGWSERRTGVGSDGHTIWRYLPDAHWSFRPSTLRPFLFAKSCRIEPIGKATTPTTGGGLISCAAYDYALYTVEYCTRTYTVCKWDDLKKRDGTSDKREFNRYVTEEYDPVGEALLIPRGSWKFAEGPLQGQPFPEGIPKILRRAKIKWTWHDVPWDCIPWSTIDSSVGKVNNAPFSGKYHDFSEGTLLLEDVETPMRVSALGNNTFDVIYNAFYNPDLHRKVFYKTGESGVDDWGFYEVTTDGKPGSSSTNGHRIYDAMNWDNLFVPTP